MNMMKIALAGLISIATLAAFPAHAGLYWNAGVRTTPVSLCFVGNALSARPDRVVQILDYMHDFELAANVRFTYLGTCPASVPLPNGNDSFAGDIRMVIPGINVSGIGMVPGNGCPMFGGAGSYNGDNDDWGSWSNAPDDLAVNRACLYNLKLGDDPWNATPYRNHTLHEVGHALGLFHEHRRVDASCYGTEPRDISNGYLTGYDINSVMSYYYPGCGALGNYAYSGLSTWDKLSIRMLYPENGRPAQIVGRSTIQTGQSVSLMFGWRAEGAYMPFVANSVTWRINGSVAATSVDFVHAFPVAGDYTVGLSVVDFLGRTHTGSTIVHVLAPAAFEGLVASTTAINATLLLGTEFSIFYDGFGINGE
ncbi:MAG TPA: hypothetical protein PKC03_12840 [Dokdonella sp.]|nr:hypothetical protein [Dokdonella sp.]